MRRRKNLSGEGPPPNKEANLPRTLAYGARVPVPQKKKKGARTANPPYSRSSISVFCERAEV